MTIALKTSTLAERPLSPQAAQAIAARDDKDLPIWIRGPRGGSRDHYCGLGRSRLYQLAAEGKIKSASLKPAGALRGTRLFHLGSILSLIEKSVEEPQA